jgi:dUTP pyrophosphatase
VAPLDDDTTGRTELLAKLLVADAALPQRTRSHDAAFDLRCLVGFELAPGERRQVKTGVAVALPSGTAGLVLPRSGLARDWGLTVVNAPGLIDPEYRGDVSVVLLNTGDKTFVAKAGDRIAQLLVVPYCAVELRPVSELPPSVDERGDSGFGSSGR